MPLTLQGAKATNVAASLRGVTAAILAGGLGTRLRAAVPDRPKVLAPVAGQPFLTRLLDVLLGAGIRRTVLLTGHLGDQVEGAAGRMHGALELEYSRESAPLGTGGALRLARVVGAADPDRAERHAVRADRPAALRAGDTRLAIGVPVAPEQLGHLRLA